MDPITWKGLLLLFALGAGPTDQPIKTTGWGQVYQDLPQCQAAVGLKAAELNEVYKTAKELDKWWVGACVEVK